MKYIDKFANIDAFLNSELRNITGDRIAVIDGFDLPILKKKLKTVVTIDPNTNEEVESQELQDVWMVPVGQVEKKVEHNFEVFPAKAIFYFSTGSGVKDYSLCFTPNGFNNVFRDNNRPMNLDYSKVGSSGVNWDASSIGRFLIENYGNTYTILYSSLKDAIYPTDGQTLDVPFFLKYDGSWKEFKCHATFEEFDISNVVLNTSMTLSPGSTIEIGSIVSVGWGRIVQSTGNSDIDKFRVYDITYTTAQGNDALTYNNLYITLPNTQFSCGYDIQGTVSLFPFINDDADKIGSTVGGNNITMPLSLHVNVLASGDIPFEFDSFDASVTYQEPVEAGDVITFELDLNETQDRDLSSYTVTGNSSLVSSYVGTTGGKVLVTMTIPNNVEGGVEYSIGDTITISNSRGYSYNFSVTYNYVGNSLDELVLPEGTTTIDSMVLNSAGYDQATNRPTKFAIPEGVTEIKSDAFWGWNIEEISFPSSLQFVGNRAFRLWKSTGGLSSVTLPAGCQYFDQSFGEEFESFDIMEQDPTTMLSTITPMTVTGGQVYSKALSEILTTEQKQTLMNNSTLNNSIWNSLDSNYYDNIQNKVTIVDFDNIFPQAGDSVDPMTQPSLYLYGANYLVSGWNLIKEVRFPSYTQGYLGESVFNGCKNLSSVSGIDNITEIGNGCFQNTALRSFNLPASVTTIGMSAFEWGISGETPLLTSFTIPANSSLTKVKGKAFAGQSNLLSVSLPEGCTYNANSFHANTVITGGVQAWDMNDPNHYGQIVEDDTTEITYGQFQNNQSDFQYGVNYYMPSTVTTISDYAFQNAGSLQRITLHEGITSIGLHAFDNCQALGGGGDSTNIVALPSTLSNLGEGAFRNCNQASFSFPASWSVTSIPENCFSGCNFYNSKNITLPSGITSIGDKAFKNCQIESVVIPSTVTSIGNGAFAGTNLTAVTLPNGCTWYETSFPDGCTVTSDTVPTPIVANLADKNASGELSADWFPMNYGYDYICSKVIIPEGVTGLQTYGGNWFSNTNNFIKEVQMPTTLVTAGIGAFFNMPNLETLDISHLQYINESLCENDTNLFKNTAPTLDANVSDIGTSAFKGTMKNVTTLDLSGYQYLNMIGGKAFEDTGLTSVTLPTNCTYYLSSFPAGCTVTGGVLFTYTEADVLRDTGVEMWPDGATSVTQDQLSNYYDAKIRVTSLTVPGDVQTIGVNTFNGYYNLTSLTFQHGEGNTLEIQTSAFENDDIRSLSIPIGCTTIGQRAFANNPNLSTLTFVSSKGEHDLTTIGQRAFADTALTAVTFPAASNATYWPNSFPAGCTVTGGTIGEYPFYINSTNSSMSYSYQSYWTKIYFQSDVTSTMSNQFEHSENIIEVEFDNSNSLTLQPNMFKDCPYLATATFKGAAVVVSAGAFSGTALTSVTLPEGSTYEPGAFPAGCTVTVATAE